MTTDELRAIFLRHLGEVAPGEDLESLSPDADLRDELDLDSMDLLTLAGKLEEALGVRIAEGEYGRLASVGGAVGMLGEKTDGGSVAPSL